MQAMRDGAMNHNPTHPSPDPRPLVAVMSSGFFGFFAHAGFLAGLQDLGLTPDAYAGASSGALVAALAAGGASPAEMLEGFKKMRREQFWDPWPPAALLRYALKGFRGMRGYVKGELYARILKEVLPCATFEECPRPCLMVALDPDRGQRVVLDSGPLIPAIQASGAVPMLFEPVEHQGRLLLDGGLVDKAPLVQAARRFSARTVAVHLLPSSSLEKPAGSYLKRRLSPLGLFNRAVDASRQQVFEDQVEHLREMGVRVLEARSTGLPRLGPKHLDRGPAAFEQARKATAAALGQAMGR